MGVENLRKEDEPFDRLTRLANVSVEVLIRETEMEEEDDPELSEVKGMVLLSDDDSYGVAVFGYSSHAEAMTDLMIQLKALMQAYGKDITVMTSDGKVVL
jgi:hypothetical protein